MVSTWRLKELIFCPWHRCLLEERCPHCEAHVDLMQDMIEPVKGKSGVEDLSWCLQCRQPLHAASALRADHWMLSDMPFWLRHWGRNGPGPIEEAGIDPKRYAQHRERLTRAAGHHASGRSHLGAR